MSPRKSNMLEAFRASDALPPEVVTRPARARASAPKRKPEGSAAAFDGLPSSLAASIWSERAPVFLIATLVGLGMLGGAYWLGRLSVDAGPGGEFASGEVLAAGTDRSRGVGDRWDYPNPGSAPASKEVREAAYDRGATPTPPAASEEFESAEAPDERDADGRTADDRSFYEKSNRFTVRAIYYGNTTKGRQRALTTYHYLRGLGLPTIAPIDQGDIIVLCVGAQPTREGRLADWNDRLRGFAGPPPRSEPGAFAGAYFVNIDDLVERP